MRITNPTITSNIQEGIKISKDVILNIFKIKIVIKISPKIIPKKTKKS